METRSKTLRRNGIIFSVIGIALLVSGFVMGFLMLNVSHFGIAKQDALTALFLVLAGGFFLGFGCLYRRQFRKENQS